MELNWKLKDLANRMNLDSTLVSRFESGSRLPTKTQALQIARILDISSDQMLALWLRDKIIQEYGNEKGLLTALDLVKEVVTNYNNALPEYPMEADLQAKIIALDNKKVELEKCKERLHPKALESLMMEYTFESNRIEGNTLTLQETDLVIQHGLTISGKSMREHLEAINHHDAIDFMKELALTQSPIIERDLMQLHSLVLRGIDPQEAGRIRRHAVIISGTSHLPPQPEHLREELDTYFEWYKANYRLMHPIIMAADIHEKFVTIHPFIDGNGRTSRLLMNLHLLQFGYPIATIKGDAKSRIRYFDTLDKARKSPDSNAFRKEIAQYLDSAMDRRLELIR